MPTTLEEVLAALNSATADAREVLTKIPQIATTNGDVPFTFADGTQITLPGLPKLKAEVDNFLAGARSEFPLFPLHENPSFIKDNGDGTYSVYGLYSVYTYGTPSVSISIVDDDTLPLDLDYSDGIQSPAKVVEITIDNSAGSVEAKKDYSVAPSAYYPSRTLEYANVRKKRIYMELMVKKVSGNGICQLLPHFLKYRGGGAWYSGTTVTALDTTEWQHLIVITYLMSSRGFPRPWFRFRVPAGETATFRITRGYAYLLGVAGTGAESMGGE